MQGKNYWFDVLYCRMPAAGGLRKAALAPGRDETRAVNALVRT